MNMIRTGLLAAAYLALGGAVFAQASGGPDARGDAPMKASHTIMDGAPKAGANSFTRSEARQHILHSGYTAVSGLTKGGDGVWRGAATRDGAQVAVALDFKGNVTEAQSR